MTSFLAIAVQSKIIDFPIFRSLLCSNIDTLFQQHKLLLLPSRSIYTDGIRAGVMSSFGLGQVGGTTLVVHPRYLFAALDPSYYAEYRKRNQLCALQSYKAVSEMMITNSLVKIKDAPPYAPELEKPVLFKSCNVG
jgi:fatty acid synthase subunit alpha, fungi type